ncbi:MAG: adenosylcobinamide amidohydrolase [Candidatus Bathyarchaeales archaeon]
MEKRVINLKIEGPKAEILYHKYRNCDMKTLLVSFNGEKRRILSTWDGYRLVKFVGNVSVPQSLAEYTMKNYEMFERELPQSLGINPEEISFLSTGADMDNLAVCERSYQEFSVCCLATGGTGNALRSGVDGASYMEKDGKFEYTPGTINMILLFNVALSSGAMARAIITATEAKTAALQDLGVRSAYSRENLATGTGTDNIIIVSGRDSEMPLRWTGGHTKIGELIGVSARLAVIEALEKQEGATAHWRKS